MAAHDFVFEAGRGAACVGLGEDVLSFHAGDEAGVARHALVADFVGGAHQPGLALLALVSDHQLFLRLLHTKVDRRAPVLLISSRNSEHGQARVSKLGCRGSVGGLSTFVLGPCGVAEKFTLEGNEACIARDVSATIHYN